MGKRGIGILSLFVVNCLLLFTIVAQAQSNMTNELSSKKQLAEKKTLKTGEQASKKLTGPPPRIVFTETSHDFGTRISGEQLKHTFEFRNMGEGVLNIEKVKAG